MKHKNQKYKLMRIWEILRQDSDEAHTISTNELVSRLAEDGIVVERKTIYEDIKLLQSMGYPVCTKRTRTNEYYAEDNGFELSELRVLIDSLQSASFLSKRLTKSLTNKVATLAGSNKGEALRGSTQFLSVDKPDSDDILSYVSILQQAIADRKKVVFRYFHLDVDKRRVYHVRSGGGEAYSFSPYALIYKDNNYYLIGILDERDDYTVFRVDRLSDVSVEGAKRYQPEWTKQKTVDAFVRQTYGMFAGESVRATFLCKNEQGVIDIVLGRWGHDTPLVKIDDEHFYVATTVQLSPQLFSWLAGLEGKVMLYSPATARQQYIGFLREQLDAMVALNGNS